MIFLFYVKIVSSRGATERSKGKPLVTLLIQKAPSKVIG